MFTAWLSIWGSSYGIGARECEILQYAIVAVWHSLRAWLTVSWRDSWQTYVHVCIYEYIHGHMDTQTCRTTEPHTHTNKYTGTQTRAQPASQPARRAHTHIHSLSAIVKITRLLDAAISHTRESSGTSAWKCWHQRTVGPQLKMLTFDGISCIGKSLGLPSVRRHCSDAFRDVRGPQLWRQQRTCGWYPKARLVRHTMPYQCSARFCRNAGDKLCTKDRVAINFGGRKVLFTKLLTNRLCGHL